LGEFFSRKIYSIKYITLQRIICIHSSKKGIFYFGERERERKREKCSSRGKSTSNKLSKERLHLCECDEDNEKLI
jgi:hypothetical protein